MKTKLFSETPIGYTWVDGALYNDEDLKDITRQPEAAEFQHETLYAFGLCDIEDQKACCCDEPIKQESDFKFNEEVVPLDSLWAADEIKSLEESLLDGYDPYVLNLENYRDDKLREELLSIMNDRRGRLRGEAEVPRAKRIIEESTMTGDELINKYFSINEITIVTNEVDSLLGVKLATIDIDQLITD